MDNYAKVRKKVKPGNPSGSKLYKTITEDSNDDDLMPVPPADRLTSAQVSIIKKWIQQGADDTDCRVPCNSDNTSFSDNIAPLIKDYCYGCHQADNTQGGINLSDYDHIRTFAANGKLLGTIKHTTGYSAMPIAGKKMTDCQIATIQNWIIEGAQNN